jgi:nucleoside-diphosphate-sugar epimerase
LTGSHQAALGSVPAPEDPATTSLSHGRNAERLLGSPQEPGSRVVYASSSAVYGDSQSCEMRGCEGASVPYALTKRNNEEKAPVQALDSRPWTRYFNVYGPRQDLSLSTQR